jgi:hypothetical protein
MKLSYIDPSSVAYYEDKLFDHTNATLNRDDTLAPFIRLRDTLSEQGIELHTADYLSQWKNEEQIADYYSLGVLDNYERLATQKNIHLRAFVVFEPPVVDQRLYRALPKLTAAFDRVYVHNVDGDGYSLAGVDRSKLRQLYWPQPRADVIDALWQQQDRQRRIVMINGNHKPGSFNGELYSTRIEAVVELARFDAIDLYGRGWERWWSRASLWVPYWRNRMTLMSIYKGACASKYEVMSNYTFALCFENMAMRGYVTEKIFDCFYAGTIPLYLGAQDITDLIPQDAYIDCRRFASWSQMLDEILQITDERIRSMREAGRDFIRSAQGLRYYNSLIEIFNAE